MKRFFALLIAGFCLSLWFTGCNATSVGSGGDIVVASKNFTEQDILGELLAQQIEATTKLKVDRLPQLGSTNICHEAILSGKIDAYIEYTGTIFTSILKQKVISDPIKVYNVVKQSYDQQFNLEVTKPLGFENTFAMIIRGEDAKKYNIKTLSEAAKYSPQWRAGFGYEFVEREDGFPGLSKTYNLKFGESPKVMDLGLIYRALNQKLVDMVAGNSTDGQIARLGLVILKDDQKYFPPYEAAPIIRKETLKKYPQLQKPLSQLAGILTADQMQELNYQVEGELRDIKEVVSEFRQSKGL